ncbi:MAG: phosphate signaling complex protein PhoU, partial [Clostridia bacterium]|nr:phosphate signaling complex protein PhoU [Clostridia bacterium]
LSIQSLVRQDEELARKVLDGDAVIDDLEMQIEEKCIRLIATQQPMAKDLRKIGVGFKIIGDLERMADHACDIARTTMRIGNEPFIKPLIDIPRMAEITQKMVKDSLDAYVQEDVDLAQAMTRDDDLVDHLHSQIFRELLTYMMEDPHTIRQSTYLLFISRYLERIADHATNIGERVVYLVTGERKSLND